MSEGKEVLQAWFQRVWTENDQSAIDEMFPGDAAAQGLGGQTLVGPDQFKEFHAALNALLSDIVMTVDKCIEADGWTSALCSMRAKVKKDGRDVHVTGNAFARVEQGKIIEAYNHFDFPLLWMQMQLLPADCYEKGLLGQKIG